MRIGAAIASLRVLLSLIVGVSRTSFAMAANRDLPRFMDAVHPHYRVPHRAELLVGNIVAVVVSIANLRQAIGFSAFTVLTDYAITNASALRLKPAERSWPIWIPAIGFAGCILLAFALPRSSVLGGLLVLLFGFGWYLIKTTMLNREAERSR